MQSRKNNNSTPSKQAHHSIDITGIMVYDAFLMNEEVMLDKFHSVEPKHIELEHIQQGHVGIFGVTGSKTKHFFVVLDRENDDHYYTRELRQQGCQTFKRKLSYHKKGVRDCLYLLGFVGQIDSFVGVDL